MRRKTCIRALGMLLMLLFVSPALADTYPSRLIQQMESYDYPSFLSAQDYVQAYDAAVVAMDACASSGYFYKAIQEAQEGYISVSALTQEGQQEHEIMLLYVFDDEAWTVTADAQNYELHIELALDAGQTLDDTRSAQLAEQMGAAVYPVNGEYFWAYFLQIFVTLTGEPVASEPDAQGGTGGVEMEANVYPLESNRSVRIDLSVRMDITEDMSDFVFLVNGEEYIPAHANPNSGTVIGRYTATRNGLYTFLLGYKINGVETTQQIDVQVSEIEDPAHEHLFEFSVMDEHPHVRYACACGETGELPLPQGPGVWTPFEDINCCLCGYHEWSGPIQQKNGSYKVYCLRESCSASQSYTLRQAEEVTQAILELESSEQIRHEYLRSDGTTGKAAYWRGVAAQAVGKLSERGFVLTTEVLNTYSDMSGSLAKAAGISPSKKDYDALQVAAWEGLIVDLLADQQIAEKSIFDTAGGVADGAASVGKVLSEADESWDDWGQLLDNTELGEKIEEYSDTFSEHTGIKIEFDPDEKSGNGMQMFGYCVNTLSSIADGLDAASDAKALFEDFDRILREYETRMPILRELIAAAQASGNELLEEAALNVKAKLEAQTGDKLDYVLSVAGAGLKETGMSTLEWGGEEFVKEFAKRIAPGAEDVLAALGAIEDIASVAGWLVDWGDAYATAQDLMTLQEMTISLDIYHTINETDSFYLAQLWTNLQIVGAEKSKEFLIAYEDGFGLNVKQLGIDDLDEMLAQIDRTVDAYKEFSSTLLDIRSAHEADR